MQSDLPKTVNEALKILAYNDYFWMDPIKGAINPHPKDRATVTSLAESQYAWTEKQARLALMILKRYITKFQAHGINVKHLVDNPVYDDEFRVINFERSIRYVTIDDDTHIEVRFPYNKKIIQLIRCLKDQRDLPAGTYSYDGDSKKWLFKLTDVTAYYLTLIAARYDFEFIDKKIIKDYDEVNKVISKHKTPQAQIVNDSVQLLNAPESMINYWDENVKHLPVLQQVDTLKNLRIYSSNLTVHANSDLARKIATKNHHKLWLDSHTFTKTHVVQALLELDAFPLIMPCHSDVHEQQEIKEFWEWLKILESHGIDIMKECSWGFDLKEPVYRKELDKVPLNSIDLNKFSNEKHWLVDNHKPREFFESLYELHQMSKQFKYIDKNTKVIFVRNRIPRALIKSKVKPKAALIALGGGYYATGTDNLKRMLENLPKKLYYSDHQPSSYDWHDHVVIKL